MKKIFFSGPVPPPITGQAFAFHYFFLKYEGEKFYVNTNSSEGKIKSILLYFSTLLKTVFHALFSEYDVTYFTCSRTFAGSFRDICLITIARFRGKRIVNHLHGADFKKYYESCSPGYKKQFKKAYQKVDESIILLEPMRREFEDFEKTMRVTEVPNFYDPSFDDFIKNGLAKKPKNKRVRLLYFSNLMYSKGILELLETFEELQKSGIEIELFIAGKYLGDEFKSTDQIKQAVAPFLQNEQITYLGTISGKEKFDFLNAGDIFVLPTFYVSEAFPISILEAMRCGNAVITTHHNYLPFILKPQNGELIEKQNKPALAKAIKMYLNKPEKLSETQSFNEKYALENFAPERFIERLTEIVNR